MEKENIAILLAMLVVAAVGVVVMVNKTSVTGLAPFSPPKFELPQRDIRQPFITSCNKQCTTNFQCPYGCTKCSPISKKCKTPSEISEELMQAMQRSMEDQQKLARFNECMRECLADYRACVAANPNQQPSICFGAMRDCERQCTTDVYG